MRWVSGIRIMQGHLRPSRHPRLTVQVTAASQRACTELALEAGFSDQSHFNREFRTVAGITPRACRDGVVTRPGRLRI